ncbi:unnamed protein product [Camellia sinensis]
MDLDERAGAIESCSAGGELVPCVGEAILEPHEGMKFESEEAAKVDKRILARQLGCNKEGHCVSIMGKFGSVRKQRQSAREGCKAMILVKSDKFGKWVVTKFVKDHNHPLVISPWEVRPTMDEEDRKIQELTAELQNKKQLCSLYQRPVNRFYERGTVITAIEEHKGKPCRNLFMK